MHGHDNDREAEFEQRGLCADAIRLIGHVTDSTEVTLLFFKRAASLHSIVGPVELAIPYGKG